jgi:hypothetical protein
VKYSISAFYYEFMKGKILKDFLKSSKIPTQLQIEEKINAFALKSNQFQNPILAGTNYYIEEGEISSASKSNQTFEAIELDLNTCINAVLDQENKVSDLYDTSFSKLKSLQNKIDTIKKNVEKVLFESKNTDTHEELFYEKFSSKDMVDIKNSTIDANLALGEVSLQSKEQYGIDLATSAVDIRLLAEVNPRISNSVDVGEMGIENIVKGSNKVWMHQISASEALSSVYVDIIIRVPSSEVEVNKIVFDPYSVDLRTQVNLEIYYSNDGLNWLIPDGENKKRLQNLTSLSFKGLKSEYWKIRLTKFGNDGFFSDSYVYNFGLRSVSFYGKKYNKISRNDLGYFYSKPIVFKNNIKIASVKICDSKPSESSIKYSLAPVYESELEDINNQIKSILDLTYYPLNFADKDLVVFDFLNVSSFPVINNLNLKESLSYKDKAQYDFCLDTVLPSGYSKSQTTLLRNGLDQNSQLSLGLENLKTQTGWAFDGSYYSTYLLVEDEDGILIDTGSTEIFINNKKVNGKVGIAKGLNFIVTHRDNWKSIDLSSLPVASTQSVDPLYPYNHKYLIEGIGQTLYGRSLSQVIDDTTLLKIIDKSGIYSSNPRNCWAIKMREFNFDTFVSKAKNELDVFSYKIDNTNQERIIVKSDPDIGLINNETFSIITKLHSAENIKGLIFKAILETTNNNVSPILTEYLVKIR